MPLPPSPVDREKVETEARAKIFWGEAREEVIAFIVVKGISRPEAAEFVDEVLNERAQTIRGAGLRKILIGIPLICLPFVARICFKAMQIIFLKVFALTVMAGLYGIWSLLTGLKMFVSPKSESGDLGDK